MVSESTASCTKKSRCPRRRYVRPSSPSNVRSYGMRFSSKSFIVSVPVERHALRRALGELLREDRARRPRPCARAGSAACRRRRAGARCASRDRAAARRAGSSSRRTTPSISKPRPISLLRGRCRARGTTRRSTTSPLRDGVGDGIDVVERDVAVHDVIGLEDDRAPTSQRSRQLDEQARTVFARPRSRSAPLRRFTISSLPFWAQEPFGFPSSRRLVQTKR